MTSFPVRTAEPCLSLPRNWYSKKLVVEALLPQSCLCDETADAHRCHTGAIAVSGYSGDPPPFLVGSRRLRCFLPQALVPARSAWRLSRSKPGRGSLKHLASHLFRSATET